jgi:hypothetical protein
LTAAAAVTIALVAPSTSKADFSVNIQGQNNQVASEQLLVTNSSLFGLEPVIGIGTVGNLAGISGGGLGVGNLSITLPPISGVYPNLQQNQDPTKPTPVGLAGTTAYSGDTVDAAGVYVGASFSQSESPTNANINSVTNEFVFNNTSASETITITVDGDFDAPGGIGSTLLVNSLVTYDASNSFTGGNGDAGDTVTYQAQSNSPNFAQSSTLSFSGGTTNGSGSNSFAFTNSTGIYALQQTFTVTLAAGDYVFFQAKMSDSILYTPAPSGWVMGLAGVPFLGLGFLRRRLGQAVPTVA